MIAFLNNTFNVFGFFLRIADSRPPWGIPPHFAGQ
jgi:hypothetical protein